MFEGGFQAHCDSAGDALLHTRAVHRPLLRLWVARVRVRCETAYHEFAEQISRPMFLEHAGCRIVTLVPLYDRHHAVLTQWRSADDIVALQLSARYQDAVKRLMATDLIEAVAPVSLWPVPTDIGAWARTLGRRVERAIQQLSPVPPTR